VARICGRRTLCQGAGRVAAQVTVRQNAPFSKGM
jgi:hypothetical protein